MPKRGFLSVIVLSLVISLVQSGCGRSAGRIAVKKPSSPPRMEISSSANMATQNLSMAKELKRMSSPEYVLGPEDVVQISVFGHDDLKMEATVSPTGKIPCYLIGDIQAGGLTLFQLRDKIAKEMAEFIKEPEIVVRIKEYQSHKVFVLGEVNTPGVYRMKNELTLLEAISLAGGVTPDAYLGGAYVVRDERILLVNFYELIEKGNTGENIPLLPNDAIYIPDNKSQKVFVLGEVNKQSAIPLENGLTLLGAIAEAGGFTQDAKRDSIVVMRGNLSAPEIMKINAEQASLAASIPLKRGDIIYVATSSMAKVERVAIRLSHILQPLYSLARTIVWEDAAVGIMEGKDSRLIIEED